MKYQIFILDAVGNCSSILRRTLNSRVKELNLEPSDTLEFLDSTNLHRLVAGAPKVGVLFSDGKNGKQFAAQVDVLLNSSAAIIPVVSSLQDFKAKVPERLYPINGMLLDKADPNLEAVVALILELLGLMRKRRRLFISYRRDESAPVAQQLHHALDERSFDVFLDTLSVRAADPFQERLWHRMTDSDIVILLYTRNVHSSGWVEDEIKRANGMKITVLQVIWPGVPRDRETEMFEPHYLADSDFDPDNTRQLKLEVLADICSKVESLRARSLAAREADLVGNLCELAAMKQLTTAIQPTRCVDVRSKQDTFARVIPVIGVPDSESLHAVVRLPIGAESPTAVVLLYNSLNIATEWVEHLNWLHKYLPVKILETSEVETWLSHL